MNTNTGRLVSESDLNQMSEEARKQHIPVVQDLTLQEQNQKQIDLYSPCACGSGKKFKFCCFHRERPAHRLGRFRLSRGALNRWDELVPFMSRFVVVDTRFRYDIDAVDYMAFSPIFEIIAEGFPAPFYNLTVNDETGEVIAERVADA